MLKDMKGLTHQKIHIEGNVKRWVYTIATDLFQKEEDVAQEDINFMPEDKSQE